MRIRLSALILLCLSIGGCFYTEEGRPCFGEDGECDEGYFCSVTFFYSGTCQLLADIGEECEVPKGVETCNEPGECTYIGGVGEEKEYQCVAPAMTQEPLCDDNVASCSDEP